MILDDPLLRIVFERHRVVSAKGPGGPVHFQNSAGRIGLGFDKLSQVLRESASLKDRVVMNIFAGPGNLLRLCSVLECRMLFGIDILYPGNSDAEWHYDVTGQFSAWEKDVPARLPYRKPIFLGKDVLGDKMVEFRNAIDVLFIDPPFGIETKLHLNLDETQARAVFNSALKISWDILRPDGSLVLIVPTAWRAQVEAQTKDVFTERIAWTVLEGSGIVSMGRLDRDGK